MSTQPRLKTTNPITPTNRDGGSVSPQGKIVNQTRGGRTKFVGMGWLFITCLAFICGAVALSMLGW